MKKINYIIISAALAVSTSSCDYVLDVEPTTQFNEIAMWSDPDVADGYVIAAYNTIADHSNLRSNTRRFYDAYTDLYKSTSWDQYEHMYNKNLMETSKFGKNNASDFSIWGEAYTRIKRTNILINSIEDKGAKFGEQWQKTRIAEARFCNAINYWFIARAFGGAVIRTPWSGIKGKTDDGQYEADRNRARASEAETYDYIISEMKAAIEDLPLKWDESKYLGRATKGMAYGFLSRLALYAHDWETVVEAADKCKELGNYDLVADYANLFKLDKDAENRKEVIYAIYGKKDITKFEFDSKMRPFGDGKVYNTSANSMGQIVPTSELADSYEFKDGTEFDWSTWSKVTDATGKRLEDPYTYREPRFHATILYNGATWEKRTIETYVGMNASIADGADAFKEYVNAGSTAG
ncbi:MAG: RagB/SusD family nutrient uptake outer membrane protein, partial [Muribaculaceae bacterium]|nr:RagB/SusD family nutrient uptake outer membrane protein [Muribaculaceae bacterium]